MDTIKLVSKDREVVDAREALGELADDLKHGDLVQIDTGERWRVVRD